MVEFYFYFLDFYGWKGDHKEKTIPTEGKESSLIKLSIGTKQVVNTFNSFL
jgi:hypothetical protein